MLNCNKNLEILISLQTIIISTLIPVYITIPFTNRLNQTFEIPITWQIPSIILITLIFSRKIVLKAFTIYLLIGLFYLPVFHGGGSVGYILTHEFGYLLGFIPAAWICGFLANKPHSHAAGINPNKYPNS